jgi:phospho-N-acetylmuramoyl-pentapeptide-transferase
VAILLKSEFVLAFVGAVFVAEMMSVIVQRYTFKWRKRRRGLEYARTHRVFRRAPLHHHFEELGWSESQVVVRFWIIGILCAFFALSTLKLR